MHEEKTGRITAIRIERIFDSRNDAVANAVKKYGATRSSNDSPAGSDQYFREDNFMQFIANQMIRELIDTAREEQEKCEKGKHGHKD